MGSVNPFGKKLKNIISAIIVIAALFSLLYYLITKIV